MALFILMLIAQTDASTFSPHLQEIPITVLGTWEVTYASDIQDICLTGTHLAIRSNGDGKIYLADPDDCSYEDEILLPVNVTDGFGLTYREYSGEYFVNSGTEPLIYHSDGSDTWSSIPNPAGTDGAGLDINFYYSDELCEAASFSPYQFYCVDAGESFGLPGINGEISGFMSHDVMTVGDNPPFALVVTTRYGHEFFFYYRSGSVYTLYGQEDCPVSVEESLGLVCFYNYYVYWSYKGTDGKYYISTLDIPIFGGIEDETASIASPVTTLSFSSNPFSSSLNISYSLPETAQIELSVYDLSGRVVEDLVNGSIAGGDHTETWSPAPNTPDGCYLIVLDACGERAVRKCVKLD